MRLSPYKMSDPFDKFLQVQGADLLKLMSRTWGGRGNQAKDVCIRLIKEGLANPQAVKAALAGLTPVDQAALAIVKEYGGIIPVHKLNTILKLCGYAPENKPDTVMGVRQQHQYILGLIKRGYLLTVPAAPGMPYIPLSLYSYGLDANLQVFCDERILQQVTWPLVVQPFAGLSPVSAPRNTSFRRPQAVSLDLIMVAQKLWEQQRFTLTKAGAVRVADIRQFRKKLSWEEDLLVDGFTFPSIANALLQTYQHSGLLNDVGGALELRSMPDRLANMTLAQQVAMLVDGFLAVTEWNEVKIEHYYGDLTTFRLLLLFTLRTLPAEGKFYALPALTTVLYDRVGAIASTAYPLQRPQTFGKPPEVVEQLVREWEKAIRRDWIARETVTLAAMLSSWLYWLGMVEIGVIEETTLAVRLTPLGREVFASDFAGALSNQPNNATPPTGDTAVWVVQPNYDVVVYLDLATPAQLAFLERHAQRTQIEQHTAHYVLTRESIYHGLESGGTVDEVLEALGNGAHAELPQNVAREIREWAGQREKIVIQQKTRLLQFPNPESLEQALAAGLRGTRVGDTYVKIESGIPLLGLSKQSPIIVDYAKPPTPCLTAFEDGILALTTETGDMLLRGQLSGYAEQVSSTQWRLTRASMDAARQVGVKAKTLLEFLTLRLRNPLPPLLEMAIRNAFGGKAAVEAAMVYLLRVKEKKLYTALINSAMLKPYLLDIPGPDTIIVSADKMAEFKEKLEALGIALSDLTPGPVRPDWQETVRDAKAQQRRSGWW